MKSRMSRRLALLKRTISGSRDAGFRIGSARRGARALAQLLDGRPRPRRLDAIADRLIERGHLGGRLAVARVVFARQPVLAERRLELILLLELAAPSRGARARPPASRARARSCSSGCRVAPARPCGRPRRPRRDCRRASPRSPWRNALPAAQPPATIASASRSEPAQPSVTVLAICNLQSQSAICNRHDPLSRIVCRPRPSRYAISIDSTPIFRIRYRPSMISPSPPWNGVRARR